MDNISQLLFLVSDSLLIPDIIVLLVLFVRALFLVGSFYNQYITKYKNERQLRPILNELTPEHMEALQAALPEKDNSLYIKYLRAILARPADDTYADYMITNFENDAEKDVVTSKLLAKVGPVSNFSSSGRNEQIKLHNRSDRKSTRLNSSHTMISYAVFCLKKKT